MPPLNYYEIIMGLIASGKSIFEAIAKMKEHSQQVEPFTPEQDATYAAELADLRDYIKHPEFKPD